MTRVRIVTLAGAASLLAAGTASAQWLKLDNQTAARLVAAPNLVVTDNLEKDFAIGDFDNDGWPDLAMVRKFAGSQTGGWSNILFMNEGGVLVDRTAEYASSSDLAGYNGFFDKTNDRDVQVGDLNNDGWLDLVTSTTMSDGVDPVLAQARVYINLGDDGAGNWLGFRHERNRIPLLFPPSGVASNPRFCDAAIGDLNGDGYADLFFVDYDRAETFPGGACIDLNNDGDTTDPGECQTSPDMTPSHDFDNKLLFNFGAANPGFFYDTLNTVMSASQLRSNFGNSVTINDTNGDGLLDVVRLSTLQGFSPGVPSIPQTVAVLTKLSTGSGFRDPKTIVGNQPYFHEMGDLNGDGRLDCVIADDGIDRYAINTGNDVLGQANWTVYNISGAPGQFDHTIRIADMDKDGRVDVIITDVDADLGPFCPTTGGRRSHFYRNVWNGANINNLLSISEGDLALPSAEREAWFDIAPMDIDNDGWLDLVVGACRGVIVYMNRNAGINYTFPSGVPSFLPADTATNLPVNLAVLGVGSLVPSSAKLNYRLASADGAWTTVNLNQTAALSFDVPMPAVACGSEIEWYIEASLTNGGPYRSPMAGPGVTYTTAIGSVGLTVLNNSFEAGDEGWTVTNQNMTGGQKGFESAVPVGTTQNGKQVGPGTAANGTRAFVTWNHVSGGASTSDLDNGPTRLLSPAFDLTGVRSPQLSYSRWFYCDDNTQNPTEADALVVEISNNGGTTWTLVEDVDWMANSWVRRTVSINDFVTPTANMRIRFSVADFPDNSLTEAGVDWVTVTGVECTAVNPCPADLNGDDIVDGNDLGSLLGQWGACVGCAADFNGDNVVDGNDLGTLLGQWGNCP